MKALIFVEINGEKFFKCDTFWSKSSKPYDAKVYHDNDPKQLKDWLQSVIHGMIFPGKGSPEKGLEIYEEEMRKYDGSKLGYFIPPDDIFKNDFCVLDKIKVEDLENPIYLWSIILKDPSEWKEKSRSSEGESFMSINLDVDTMREFVDYKQIHREETINDLLKKD